MTIAMAVPSLTSPLKTDRPCRCPTACATMLDRAAGIMSQFRDPESVGSRVEELSKRSKRMVRVARPDISGALDRHSGRLNMACAWTFKDSELVRTDEGLPASSPLLKRLRFCPEVRAQVVADVKEMCGVLHKENGTEQACVTLQSLHGTMCPRVHADFVTLRALCTYLGPGTDYFPCEAVVMQGDRVQAAAPSEARSAATGDILYLKGNLDKHGAPAAHRSPEYDGRRLLLVVQSNSDARQLL